MTARSHESTRPNSSNTAPPGTEAVARAGGPAASQVLAQKDQLIQALTDQLEQAAEQLDRLQRAGADRKRGGLVGGGSGLTEEHRQTFDDLQRIVQQWEDLQAGLTLGRIEIQLSELRDLVVDGFRNQPTPRVYSGPAEIEEEPAELPGEDRPRTTHASDSLSHWEQVKNQLLNEGADDTEEIVVWPDAEVELRDLPPAINISQSSRDDLVEAVQQRDDYISYLLARVRQLEALQPAAALERMAGNQPELIEQVQVLERKLQEHLRCAEVEMSVERARIGRERMQQTQQQELIDRTLKRLGLTSADDADASGGTAGNVQERRWARFLGRSKND